MSPRAALQAQMDRVGARALDTDGPETAEFFWRQHAMFQEQFDSPQIAELIADGTLNEARVAATRDQIELAAAWARAGRVDVGKVLLDLLELTARRRSPGPRCRSACSWENAGKAKRPETERRSVQAVLA